MMIGEHDIEQHVLLIAEIGNNHEGDVNFAEELIGLAADAGADAVKFQTIVPERLVAPEQIERLVQLRKFSLNEEAFVRLADTARSQDIMFLSTPFCESVVPFVASLCPAIKVASGDNDHVALLRSVARTGLPVLLSTGMADLELVAKAVGVLESAWADVGEDPDLVLMHCVSAYPTPTTEANIRALQSLSSLGRPVGYSDHTLGTDAAVVAVAAGARVIEKHFTDRHNRSSFRDHALSATPNEFTVLAERVRETEILLGDGAKRVMPSERDVVVAARRSLHASRTLAAGEVIAAEDLIGLRPATSLPVNAPEDLIGKRVAQDLPALHRFALGDFE